MNVPFKLVLGGCHHTVTLNTLLVRIEPTTLHLQDIMLNHFNMSMYLHIIV